jgi:polysaccharide chain length determinant protein (PEP-CTERM system associated)
MVGKRTLEVEDYIRVLRKRWLPITALGIAGGLLSFGVATRLPKRFTSQTTVLVEPPNVPADYVRPVVTQDVNQRLAAMQQQILSRTRLEPIIDQFGLYRAEPGKTRAAIMEELVDRLQKAIAVSPVQAMPGTGGSLPGFNISVTFNDAHLAQQLCTTITSLFMEKNLELRQSQAEDTTQFLGSQLGQAKAKLDEQDTKLADFKRHYVGSLPEQEAMNFNILMGLNSQFEAVTQAVGQTQQDKAFADAALAQQLSDWKAAGASGSAARDPETMDQHLSALEEQLAALELKYTDSHPDVIRMKSNIAALEQQIAAANKAKPANIKKDKSPTEGSVTADAVEPAHIQQLRAQIHELDQTLRQRQSQEADLQGKINAYQSRVQSSPAIEQDYKELTRDYQTALDFYNDLLRKQTQSAMATDLERRQEGEQFMVLDPANLPDKPSFPNKPVLVAAGALGGLGLGLGLSLWVEIQDTSLRSERDVEHLLHMPVLAMVPVVAIDGGKKKLPASGTTSGPMRLRA